MKQMMKKAINKIEKELEMAKALGDNKAVRAAETKIDRATKALEREYEMDVWEV